MFSKIKEDSQDDDIKSKDIIREIAQRWKSLSEKHRKKYINEAAEVMFNLLWPMSKLKTNLI